MSALRKRLAGSLPSSLPPRPQGRGKGRGADRGGGRSYTALPWTDYWQEKQWLETSRGRFCSYSLGGAGAGCCVLLLHGGGYSALTWSLLAKELGALADCALVAVDLRGHGETEVVGEETDLSGETMVQDVLAVVDRIQEKYNKGLVLVGHSMGGALAALVAEAEVPGLAGLVVLDVVEGTALEALAGMQGVLRSRPTKFASVEQAVEWCVRTGQVRNHESARVSMPGQIRDASGRLAALLVEGEGGLANEEGRGEKVPRGEGDDTITEEVEEGDMQGPTTTVPPAGHFSWRVDLARSEPHWAGWFRGLSQRFLNVPAAKLLLLAGVDRLDRDLTVGQMQGKFQMQVLPAVGHTVHEDSPDKVAEVLAAFLVRNKLASATELFQPAGPGSWGHGSWVMGPPSGPGIEAMALPPGMMGPPRGVMGPPRGLPRT